MFYQPRPFIIAAICCLLAACNNGPDRAPSMGEAFVGPALLTLRQDLGLKSAVVGSVKHGDRLEVIQTRRRFTRVRTKENIEGWIEQDKLLSTAQMKALRIMTKFASQLPSQGQAIVYEPLNMHTAPNKFSPSFYQIAENESISVLMRKVSARVRPPPERKAASPAPPASKKKKGKKDEKAQPLAPPPLPQGPPVPKNWKELSFDYQTRVGSVRHGDEIPVDAWSLVRTKDGRAGWVLFRLVFMQIPDYVAQYASGQRITSYFPMGEPANNAAQKGHWLWTTLSDGKLTYDFDSVRLFHYNSAKKRYETAFSERNIIGHFPAIVDLPRFSYIVQDSDGKMIRKTYNFEGRRAKLISKEPYSPPPDLHLDEMVLDPKKAEDAEDTINKGSWADRINRLNPWRK